jgi:hypothetical protein
VDVQVEEVAVDARVRGSQGRQSIGTLQDRRGGKTRSGGKGR